MNNTKSQTPDNNYISVIMPVFNQASFIRRAIISLLNQTHKNWELIIINDASTDELEEAISSFLPDKRIRLFHNISNEGLGYSLNKGIDNAKYDYIAYLPADDIYYKNHLETLLESITLGFDFAHAGMIHEFHSLFGDNGNFGRKVYHKLENMAFQLIQVLHRKTPERWTERNELESNDLDELFWNKYIVKNNRTIGTREITCEWVDHPMQRHKIMDECFGGNIFLFKSYYGIKTPIRFETSYGGEINEIKQYEHCRKESVYKKDGLRILLVGELSYNPERICAFEEQGHKLYGLWIKKPTRVNTVGPLAFGNIEDIPYESWTERVKEIKPDIIYSLLNDLSIPLAHEVLLSNLGIPFVWHFKEGPLFSRSFGLWPRLIDLYQKSDGQIYNNEITRDWFLQFISPINSNSYVLDGDLQKKTWFTEERSPLLSEKDGEIHIVVAGRPFGITPEHINQMGKQKIHLHIYGNSFISRYEEMLKKGKELAPNHLHLHDTCLPHNFVKEFSQYNAGFLHNFQSENNGELLRASWNDLNSPARMSTYGMAGLPMLIYDNKGHRVATQEFLEKYNMALKYTSISELSNCFKDKDKLKSISESVWNNRDIFSFDYHVPSLIEFFHQVILSKQRN